MTTPDNSPPVTPGDSEDGFNGFPIVGLGASAGGLEAFTQVLENLPEKAGMAFVLVQHLDPHHISHLRELLERKSKLPVIEAAPGMPVRPDHVYVIPPNVDLTLEQGLLQMTPRPGTRAPHLSIDHFFRSLARAQGSRSVGVLLSGSGSDGTTGLEEIKAAGGITFAQDEASARHYSMPGSAVESGSVDFVLPPDQIARRLAEIGGHPYLAQPVAKPQGKPDDEEEELRRVLSAVRDVTRVDFTQYRDTTIKRRIRRRMALHGVHSVEEYANRLYDDRTEVELLYRDLLINVTSFFRDPELFEALKERAFPEITKKKGPKDPVRIWVPGCSTGQEAYSIAIALIEFLDDKQSRPDVQIFATDLSDATTLDKARSGVYPATIEAEVSPERLRRFFRKEDHGYRINKSIREQCIFARQNMASDPPFSHLDLISCRNVLIYMSPALQKQVVPMFHYALDSPGFLVLGSSEALGHQDHLFDSIDRAHRIYQKKPAAHRAPLSFGTSQLLPHGARKQGAEALLPVNTTDFNKEADRILAGRYLPPGVLVTESFEILQFRGDTSPFLQTPAGEPTTNLLRMAREGLFLDLRRALEDARKTHEPTLRSGVTITDRQGTRQTTVRVLPVKPRHSDGSCYLVLFEEPGTAPPAGADGVPSAPFGSSAAKPEEPPSGARRAKGGRAAGGAKKAPESSASRSSEAEDELVRLRHEFAATKEYLQSVSEQQDAANEELRAANEEILSSNEELQSTNEELETAKEELQSTNEELTTVNEQLQHRNVELDLLSNDLANVLSSTGIPLAMVGSDLRVRRVTPAAKKILSLLPTDVGRPIGEIQPGLSLTSFDRLITDVIDQVKTVEQEVRDSEGRWWLLRIHPYRTADNRIDGAVLFLLDVDALKRAEETLRETLEYSSAIVETTHEPLLVLDQGLEVVSANPAFYEKFGLAPGQIEGLALADDANRQWNIPAIVELLEQVRRDRRDVEDFAVEHEFRNLGWRSLQVNVRVIERGSRPFLLLLAIEDVTERQRRIEARAALEARDRFVATMSHEMRNPLAAIDAACRILRLHAGEEDAAAAHARQTLERQLSHLIRLVDDFLEVSRLDHDKIQLHRQPVDVERALEHAVDAVRPMVEAYPHRVKIIAPAEPLRVDADPVRLEQILVNLLNNALKFSGDGGTIEVGAEVAPGEPGGTREVVIRVRDQGIGIPPDLMERMFDDFTQGEGAPDQGGLGLGLGLGLVKRLVTRHGGTVRAISDGGGRGTEVRVRLPEARDGEAASPAVNRSVETPPSHTAVTRHVLVVEDNPDAAQMLAILLEKIGHDVRTVADGPAALAAIREAVPDYALIDVGLPGMSGYDLAREIRKLPQARDLTLIAHTGYGQEEDRERARAAGFDHHMVKPLDWKALQRVLEGG